MIWSSKNAGWTPCDVVADWRLVSLGAPVIGLIVVGEGVALLVYLRIARDYGATYVSFANYVSMVFAAIIGAVVFGDQITGLTVLAAGGIIASVILYQRYARGTHGAAQSRQRVDADRCASVQQLRQPLP